MHRAKIVATSLLAGLAVLVIEQAVYVFFIPHGGHFAPQLGPSGAFIVFTAFFSIAYTLAVLIVEIALQGKLKVEGRQRNVVRGTIILAIAATLTCAILMANAEMFTMPGIFVLPALASSLLRSGSWAT